MNVVNDSEEAIWLIAYWCNKDSWTYSNAVFKTLDYAHRSLSAHKEQDTFISVYLVSDKPEFVSL